MTDFAQLAANLRTKTITEKEFVDAAFALLQPDVLAQLQRGLSSWASGFVMYGGDDSIAGARIEVVLYTPSTDQVERQKLR